MRINRSLLFSGIASSLLAIAPAKAQPPANADPELAPFYHGLTLPGQNQGYCCSAADCRSVVAEWRNGHWEVFIDKKTYGESAPNDWRSVPDSKISPDPDVSKKPEGATACWYQNEVRCFNPPRFGS